MSDTFGAGSRARAAASRRDVLRGAGLAAGAATFGGWLPAPASAQETFVWYTGLALEASDELSKMFTAKTGIPAEYFRAGSNNLAQKFEQEVQADQVRCSALLITTPTLVARWAEQGLILMIAPSLRSIRSNLCCRVSPGRLRPSRSAWLTTAR